MVSLQWVLAEGRGYRGESDEDEPRQSDKSIDNAMDVDDQLLHGPEDDPHSHEDGLNEEEDDGEEDSSDTAMVPMADMLNARYACENVYSAIFILHVNF